MSSDVVPTSPPAAPAAKPRRKRRLLKLFIALVVALVVVVIAVQVFLSTDYPRQIAVGVAQNVTGLRVRIEKLDIAWSGRTDIGGLSVALPLEDKPFLEVDEISARHTSLLGIVATQNVAINAVTVTRPKLHVRQAADGTWNLQQALAQLATPGKNASSSGPAALPDVDLVDGVADVTTADGKRVAFNGLVVTGRRQNALAWKLIEAKAGDLASATGEISSAGAWPHEFSVDVKPALFRAIEPLTGPLQTVASASLHWRGERTATGVQGRLGIPEKTTQLGPIVASGSAKIVVDGATVSVSPENFTVDTAIVPPVTLAGGTVTLNGRTLTLTDLRTRFAEGAIRLTGSAELDPANPHGAITASWDNVAFPAGVVHNGRAALEAANIWPSRPWVQGEIQTSGTAAGGKFDTRATVKGEGPSWTDATYVVELPLLRYGRRSEVRLSDVRATFHNTNQSVELVGVRLRQTNSGAATLDAHGLWNFAGPDAGRGYFTAVGNRFLFAGQPNLFFNVNAWADKKTVTLQNAYANLGRAAWANLAGQYVFGEPDPVRMQLDFDTPPATPLRLSDSLLVAGQATGTMKVGGTATPPNVTLDGTLSSRALKLNDKLIGDADLVVRGNLDADRADLTTDHLTAFGGRGWFGFTFPYFSDQVQAWMGFADISLADLGRAVGTDRLTGTAAGRFDLFVPTENVHQLTGTGEIKVAKPSAGPILQADSLTIPVGIGDGYVSLRPVAKQAKGGSADVNALLSLNEPTKFRLNVDLDDWHTPLPLADFSVVTDGRIRLPQFDLAALAGNGRIEMKHGLFAANKPIGDVHAILRAGGRQVRLERVSGRVLEGEVYGRGSIDFNNLAAGELWAGVKGLSLDHLAQLDPRLVGMQGQLSAYLHTHAATSKRPLGPVQADIDVDSDRATYKGIEIGDSRVRLFADRTRVAMADDIKDPNVVRLAGGEARLWGRISQVPADQVDESRTSAFVSVRLKDIDTEQLNQMIDPDGKAVPGRIGGEVVVFGNPADVRRLSGQGRLDLTDSDLGNIGPLAALYNAMRLGLAPSKPSGEGTVGFRVNDGRFVVTGLNYFNRGVFARGAITVDNVLDLKSSHLSGYLLGTYRPLKDLKLPFFGTFDEILDALQSSATTIRVDGTMEKPNPVQASLKEIGGDLKAILVGEAQAQ